MPLGRPLCICRATASARGSPCTMKSTRHGSRVLGAGAQADEVYKLGIEREARPQQRLVRKFGEFEQRRDQQDSGDRDTPASPALPTARPALVAKVDPFAAGGGSAGPSGTATTRRSRRPDVEARKSQDGHLLRCRQAGARSGVPEVRDQRGGRALLAGRSQEGEHHGRPNHGWAKRLVRGGRRPLPRWRSTGTR